MSCFCQNQKQRGLKFQIYQIPKLTFLPQRINTLHFTQFYLLYFSLSMIHHTVRLFCLRVTLFHSQWQVFSSTALKQLRHLAAFSRLSYPHLATELGFYSVTAFFTISLFLFSKLHITYTHFSSVIFFSYVINTSFVTSIPRPSCAPHQLPSHLRLSSLILTQTLSCQLYNLFLFLSCFYI